jgi:hypothetical protein
LVAGAFSEHAWVHVCNHDVLNCTRHCSGALIQYMLGPAPEKDEWLDTWCVSEHACDLCDVLVSTAGKHIIAQFYSDWSQSSVVARNADQTVSVYVVYSSTPRQFSSQIMHNVMVLGDTGATGSVYFAGILFASEVVP